MSTSQHSSNVTVWTVRIPAEIAEKMRQIAKQHDRSLNGEIVRMIREYVEKYQTPEQEREP
jgi:predicted transcriptional regulator